MSSNKNIVFQGDGFLITFLIWEMRKWKLHRRVFLIELVRSMHVFTWKVNFKIWPQVRSDQGLVMTQISQYANIPMHRNIWRVKSFGTVSISMLSRHIGEKRFVTSFDLIWPQVTSPWPPIVSYTRIITDRVSGHDPERIGWFRLVYAEREAFSYFFTGL